MVAVRGVATFMLALLVGSGCAATIRRDPPPAGNVVQPACLAADSTSRASAISAPFVGEYRLTMVATSGARSGRSTSGTLTLNGHIGHASIALDSVGATAPGDIASRDPNRPGVLVVTSPNDSSVAGGVLLRFGADANRTDIRPFDGAYLVLTLDVATAEGFSGRWRSGVGTTQSGGYYCADFAR